MGQLYNSFEESDAYFCVCLRSSDAYLRVERSAEHHEHEKEITHWDVYLRIPLNKKTIAFVSGYLHCLLPKLLKSLESLKIVESVICPVQMYQQEGELPWKLYTNLGDFILYSGFEVSHLWWLKYMN
jgi:hypothetical protein